MPPVIRVTVSIASSHHKGLSQAFLRYSCVHCIRYDVLLCYGLLPRQRIIFLSSSSAWKRCSLCIIPAAPNIAALRPAVGVELNVRAPDSAAAAALLPLRRCMSAAIASEVSYLPMIFDATNIVILQSAQHCCRARDASLCRPCTCLLRTRFWTAFSHSDEQRSEVTK